MILDYCRENKVAILFNGKHELDALNELFTNGQYKEDVNFTSGIVTYYKEDKRNYQCSGYPCEGEWYKDYTIITMDEFWQLENENILVLINN